MEYTPEDRTATNPLRGWAIRTLKHFPTTNGPLWQTDIRTNWQNAQMTQCSQRSSVADRHQNQLAKCPNSTSCSKEKFAQLHTGGLTWSWSSLACPDASFHSTKEKRKLAASAEQGRNREDPWNKWYQQLLGTSPQILLSGPDSQEQRLIATTPCVVMAGGWPCLGKPLGSQISRERSLTLGAKNCLPLKSQQAWGKGKFALFQSLATWEGWCGLMSKGWLLPSPHHNQGARAFTDGGRGLPAETTQSALTVFLKFVMQWSDQRRHLDCFKYS